MNNSLIYQVICEDLKTGSEYIIETFHYISEANRCCDYFKETAYNEGVLYTHYVKPVEVKLRWKMKGLL